MSNVNFNKYIITKNIEDAKLNIKVLRDAGVSEECLGVVSRDDDIVLADLPQVDLTDKSQLPESLRRGALLGSGTGLISGVLLATFPVAGITAGGAAIAALTAGGGAVGAWSASMIGISEKSDLIDQFESALDKKYTLILCEIDDVKFSDIEGSLNAHSTGQVE